VLGETVRPQHHSSILPKSQKKSRVGDPKKEKLSKFPASFIPERGHFVSQEVNVLALTKGSERYIFLFNEEHRADTFRAFARYASDPELSFSWYDAAIMSRKIRQSDSSETVNLNSMDF